MATPITQLDVFISAPGDMDSERKLVQQLVLELSEELRLSSFIQLRPFFWKDDAIPGIGDSSQSVINSQIAVKCDVLIGLLGQRFGTPTSRAGSGTEEEFDQIYDRYIADTTTVRVLTYFRMSAENIYGVDPEEMAKLRKFRDKLQKSGVLYRDYGSADDLASTLKRHLRELIATDWHEGKWKQVSLDEKVLLIPTPIPVVLPAMTEVEAEDSADDLGFLDALAIGEEAIGSMNGSLERIAEHATTFSHDIQGKVQEVNSAVALGNARDGKNAVDDVAVILTSYARGLASELPIFKTQSEQVVLCVERLSQIHFKEGVGNEAQIRTLVPTLTSLVASFRSGRSSMAQLEQTISSAPALTIRMKQAKRLAVSCLRDFNIAATLFINKAESTKMAIEDGLALINA